MFRDTTPTLIFELPFDSSLITDLDIALAQGGEIVDSYGFDMDLAVGNEVGLELSRHATSKLKAGIALEIQLHLLVGNESLYSEIFRVPVERILREWEATADEV